MSALQKRYAAQHNSHDNEHGVLPLSTSTFSIPSSENKNNTSEFGRVTRTMNTRRSPRETVSLSFPTFEATRSATAVPSNPSSPQEKKVRFMSPSTQRKTNNNAELSSTHAIHTETISLVPSPITSPTQTISASSCIKPTLKMASAKRLLPPTYDDTTVVTIGASSAKSRKSNLSPAKSKSEKKEEESANSCSSVALITPPSKRLGLRPKTLSNTLFSVSHAPYHVLTNIPQEHHKMNETNDNGRHSSAKKGKSSQYTIPLALPSDSKSFEAVEKGKNNLFSSQKYKTKSSAAASTEKGNTNHGKKGETQTGANSGHRRSGSSKSSSQLSNSGGDGNEDDDDFHEEAQTCEARVARMAKIDPLLAEIMQRIVNRDPEQIEFHQAVEEVLLSIWPFIRENPRYQKHGLIERIVEPERVITFRVSWVDDQGRVQVNRGFRVQMNSALGPFKGGLRFHPTVNLSVLKFLAFEQVFKNSLTTLPMGGAKGGSDFNPKDRSDEEVMRFCQAFMTELYRHIGPDTDVPAGDIGVGGREIGYLYGQYKRLANEAASVLTGKGLSYGGSLIRPEATGYGTIYFTKNMLERSGRSFKDQRVRISGSGNVAQFAALKAMHEGAFVTTLSDSNGTLHAPKGLSRSLFDEIVRLKDQEHGRLRDLNLSLPSAKECGAEYFEDKTPWDMSGRCDIALPCATQNELELSHARALVKSGCYCVAEGANMPCTADSVQFFIRKKVLYAPGKASNAGGVTVSGLEMSQNAMRLAWETEEVDNRLRCIMKNIHDACIHYGTDKDGHVNYVNGANIAGFVKVADAMISQGII